MPFMFESENAYPDYTGQVSALFETEANGGLIGPFTDDEVKFGLAIVMLTAQKIGHLSEVMDFPYEDFKASVKYTIESTKAAQIDDLVPRPMPKGFYGDTIF